MHLLWLHVIPELVFLWISERWQNEPWSIRYLRDEIKVLLKLVTPPHGRQELPQDLDEAKSWKAATSRFFALY